MIRLILLISFSISPLFLTAQNISEQERQFLGGNANRYLNAYRYPQRTIESGRSSSTNITNKFLNHKINRSGTVIVQSHEPAVLPEFELSELPTVEKITLPSDAPRGAPAPILSLGEIKVPTATKRISKPRLTLQEKQLKSAVEELKKTNQETETAVAIAEKVPPVEIKKVAVKPPAIQLKDAIPAPSKIIKDSIPVGTRTNFVQNAPKAVPAEANQEVSDSQPRPSSQVEELRSLIEKLKAARSR